MYILVIMLIVVKRNIGIKQYFIQKIISYVLQLSLTQKQYIHTSIFQLKNNIQPYRYFKQHQTGAKAYRNFIQIPLSVL